ncbi:hypothetical protein [Amycolatopsis dendrobii]|uniref:Uncharacterized protein n=1 Tax=Amycolatopsis dendrobii TaxID=2760662 RepID=A0A7W3VRY8_9PSEU|nr:hypothetical protein [Amycolatopsis dendrobii]MBB1152121.1 hypothetical protein [Amycolatopsis dendrobii]
MAQSGLRGFAFSLRPATRAPGRVAPAPDGDPGFDALVIEACQVLAATDCAFTVRGFGGSWPVDVAYDLSTLVEQLPRLLRDLRARRDGQIGFYGQGIERTVHFSPCGERLRLTCTSRTSWTPDPAVEIAGAASLEEMILRLMSAFSSSLETARSPLADASPFSSWR